MPYTVSDKSLGELLADLESQRLQGQKGAESYELAQAAISIKTAQAMMRWARVSAIAACTSTGAAIAAVLVAALR